MKFKQFYKGIKVEKGMYVLDYRDGKIRKANGYLVRISDLDTIPKITPEEASKSYAEYLNIKKTEELKFVSVIAISQIEDFTSEDTTYSPRVCYKITLLNAPSSQGETGYVDVQTGKVYKSVKLWDDFATTATFETYYSGNRTANTEYYNSEYNLADFSRDANIHTWDLNNTYYTAYASNRVEFTDSNTSWEEDEHEDDNDQMALDIHWALQEVYDYFYDNHNEFGSFDGADTDIDGYVHAVFEGNSKDNAKWADIGGYIAFYFGDGGGILDLVASVDVVAHEYAHAITYTHSGLENDNGVEDAIQEGLSDIWAVIIENDIAPEKDAWKIGEEVIDVAGDNCLRNIQDPGSAYANMQMSDTYEGDNYDGDYYAKSGVISHWFYLLAEGGSGTNDNDDDYTVWELGIDAAADIVFDGITTDFLNVTTFYGAYEAMLEGSDDVYGTNSIQSLQVKNAWYAVGVLASPPGQVTITGPTNDLVCSSGASFTVNNVPSGHTVSWTCSTNLTLVSSSGNNATFNTGSSASSAGWVQANINNTTYGGSVPVRYEVWAGKPQITNKKVDGYNYYTGFQICPGDHYLNVTPVGGNAGTATWTVPYGITYFVGTNTMDFTFPSNANSVAITARSTNTCGTGPNSSFYLTKKTWGCYDSYAMTLSPNPASDYVTIIMLENQPLIDYAESGNTSVDVDVKAYEPTTYTINIYNNQSTKLSSVIRSGKSFNVPLINLLDGTYTIEVSDGRNSYRQQLIVKHN